MIRRPTRSVSIGPFTIGSEHPIRVQSMTNTPPQNVAETMTQIRQLYEAQCEIIRLSIPNRQAILSLQKIQRQLQNDKIPIALVADVHFSPSIALACIPFAHKVRINPGNFNENFTAFTELIRSAKREGTAIRIGVNGGSLSKKILEKYGNGGEAMYQSTLPFLEIADAEGFNQMVLSFKASDVGATVTHHREILPKLDQRGFNFPLHLGLTEAGDGVYGRIKSAIAMGSLLLDGMGDTVRVSLTENPVQEIAVAYDILQACGKRFHRAEYIACPSCGRTQFDIQSVFAAIKEKTAHLVGIKIAVMGCMVNGLGEMGDADFGYVGAGPGKVNLYRRNQCVKTNIPEQNAVTELLKIIEASRIS